jgi:hypothetical protein
MRTLIISALGAVALALAFSSPAAAQSGSTQDSLSESLAQTLSFSSALPMFPSHAQFGAANANNENPSNSANALLKDKAFAQLRLQLGAHSAGVSSGCAHILIYVPPVTDTKMIIKVPGSDKLPEGADNGRATPSVGACGEDLRRVEAPHQPPPSRPDGRAKLIPVHQPGDPH